MVIWAESTWHIHLKKTVDGKQCTTLWHADDLEISCVDSKVVDSIIKIFGEKFGIYASLTSARRKIHDYLGMVIDYTTKGKVLFAMFDYIDNVLNELPGGFYATTLTPAYNHLFVTNNNQTNVIPE